jgi:hypothetical protein
LLAEEAADAEALVGAALVGEPTGEPGDGSATRGGDAAPVEQVDALFAKLRAAQGDEGTDATAAAADDDAPPSPADAAEDGEGPPEARHPLVVQRDELVAPIITGLARRLKRSLQDSQNDLLDKLRAKGTTWSTDLLPDETEHVDSFSTSAMPFLEEGADAGATLVGGSAERPSADALLGIAHELAEAIVAPLRRRLAAGDGLDGAEESVVTEHIGTAFREWKGERIERLSGDHVVAAFSLGTIAVAGKGELEWVAVAPADESPCPDCEDNGLNGAQAAGESFPTGHAHPPAHPGCRCLLAPSTP